MSDEKENLDNIIQQNNYTHTYLIVLQSIKIMGEQLERIENQIINLITPEKNINK